MSEGFSSTIMNSDWQKPNQTKNPAHLEVDAYGNIL